MTMDIVAVSTGAARECVRQQVGLTEVGYLLDGYRGVYHFGLRTIGDFITLGRKVEPIKNAGGFRVTPVTFRDGGTSAPVNEIYRKMENLADLVESWAKGRALIGVDAMVKEFLWIHPFRDGNGRAAWVMRNYLAVTMDNPQPLPYYFGEK